MILIKKAMLTTHVAPISLVLGGPISRRTVGHRDLRHLETVRHDFFTHSLYPTRARVVSSVSFAFHFFEGAWMLTQRKTMQ